MLLRAVQWNLYIMDALEPIYYGRIGIIHKCPDYQCILINQFSLHDKAPFVTMTKCVDYAGVLIIKCSH